MPKKPPPEREIGATPTDVVRANIRAEIDRAGITQAEFVRRMWWVGQDRWRHPTTFHRLMDGQPFTTDELVAAALALGVTVEALLVPRTTSTPVRVRVDGKWVDADAIDIGYVTVAPQGPEPRLRLPAEAYRQIIANPVRGPGQHPDDDDRPPVLINWHFDTGPAYDAARNPAKTAARRAARDAARRVELEFTSPDREAEDRLVAAAKGIAAALGIEIPADLNGSDLIAHVFKQKRAIDRKETDPHGTT
jgi:hypothetical protein